MQVPASNCLMAGDREPSAAARRVQSILEARGWTRQRLEREAKLTTGYASRWLNGDRQSADVEKVQAIAKALGVRWEWVLSGDGLREAPQDPESQPAAADEADTEGPLERALGLVFTPGRHQLSDANAVRATFSGMSFRERSEADMLEAARCWIDAAASLRRRGLRVTAESIAEEVTFSRGAAERAASANAAGDAKARELGVEPGSAADRLSEALKRRR